MLNRCKYNVNQKTLKFPIPQTLTVWGAGLTSVKPPGSVSQQRSPLVILRVHGLQQTVPFQAATEKVVCWF